MADTEQVKKIKKLRVGFFTSSDAMKIRKSNANQAFEALYASCINAGKNSHTAENETKKLKIVFLDKDIDAGFYFGYISCSRDGFHLPYIGDEHWDEQNILLDDKKYIVERTYFLYYFKTDLLLLSLNHLGPKVKDLSYLLFNTSTTLEPVSFEAIWKEESVKELLETGSTLRSCDITLAAPRNFNATSYDLSSSFSKSVIDMLAGTGGSHLKLALRGRAAKQKKVAGYLADDVKDGLKELLEKVPGIVRKADVTQPRNTKSKSLLDQVLVSKINVYTLLGYAAESDIRTAIIQAKIENGIYLSQYETRQN